MEEKLNKLFEFTGKYYWEKDILKYLEYHPAPKILIVQPSRIGDIVFSMPVLSAIKKRYSYARLRRWGSHKFAGLAEKLKSELDADIVFVGGKEGGASEKDSFGRWR